jgi:hypothetical protein
MYNHFKTFNVIIITFTILLTQQLFAFDLNKIEDQYKALVDKTIDWRSKAIKFNLDLNNPKKIITSRQITTIHTDIINEYKVIRDEYRRIINIVRPISEYKPSNIYYNSNGENGPIKLEFNWYASLIKESLIYDYFAQDRNVYAIDLNTTRGQETIRNMKMGLASAVILYDNYALVLSQFQNSKKVRRLVNQDNVIHDGFLNELNKTFTRNNYEALTRGYLIYKDLLVHEDRNPTVRNAFGDYLNSIVSSSYLYSIKDKVKLSDIQNEGWENYFNRVLDNLDLTKDNVANSASKFFGNTAGLVVTRKGKLIDRSDIEVHKLVRNLSTRLKPLDVLIEKTPFRLTDKFIPGYWGHIAIWLGTESQLKKAGLWDSLSYELKTKVQTGHHVLEALRPGVQVNKLINFLDIDDLAVIRPNFLKTKNDVAYYLNRAQMQIGKEYDFAYDVETDKRIVCSELAYVVFDDPEFKWAIEKSLGRYTISPDNIAEKGRKAVINSTNYSFTPMMLFLNGEEVTDRNGIQYMFEQLIK